VVLLSFLCGLAELFLCIHPVYLGASYAFLMKFSYLSKKKKYRALEENSFVLIVVHLERIQRSKLRRL
jgi:hypothetical protein